VDIHLPPRDDYRHVLQPGEHEAVYFVFTTPTGDAFGIARALFSHDAVLEMATVRAGGRTWVFQQRQPWPAITQPDPDASGPTVRLHCEEPWARWQIGFDSPVHATDSADVLPLTLAFDFHATCPPAGHRFGPAYYQAEQGGRLTGALTLGAQTWTGDWPCIRDHTWGRRPMTLVDGCQVVAIPGRLHLVLVQTPDGLTFFGRAINAAGDVHPLVAPQLTATDSGWRVTDPALGALVWDFHRLSAPLIWHLGRAGVESVRDAPQPGDLLREETGPARFTANTGETCTGFFDQLWRVNL